MYYGPQQQPHGEGITLGFGFYAAIMGTIGIFSLFTPLGLMLANIPILTVLGFQLWRIFTALFAIIDIFSLIISLLLLFMMSFDERRTGTSRFILSLFFRSVAIQIGVTIAGLLIAIFTSRYLVISFGIMPTLMVSLTLQCLQNPEGETNLCCGALPVKNKYYPVVLIAIFGGFGLVLMNIIPADLIIGYLLALWMNGNPMVRDKVDPSYSTVVGFENFLRNLDGKLGKLILENEAGHFEPAARNPIPMQQAAPYQQYPAHQQYPPQGYQNYGAPYSPGRPMGAGPQPESPQPFAGRGLVIGGSDVQPAANWQQPHSAHACGYPQAPYNQPQMR